MVVDEVYAALLPLQSLGFSKLGQRVGEAWISGPQCNR